MHPDSAKLLWDAQLAAQKTASFTAGKTFFQYEADELLRADVERQFEIVGEAIKHLSRLDAVTASAIPDLPCNEEEEMFGELWYAVSTRDVFPYGKDKRFVSKV